MDDTPRFKVIKPNNAPNFCFEKVDAETGESIQFIQSERDRIDLALYMGWEGEQFDAGGAFDFITAHLGEVFEEQT